MPPLLNTRHESFCLEYVKDGNGTRSYKAAGYNCSTKNCAAAARLLRSVKVTTRIRELGQELHERLEDLAVDRAWVVKGLVEIANRGMQAVPALDSEGNPTGQWKHDGKVVNQALELIGKHLGMFVDATASSYRTYMRCYIPQKGQGPNEFSERHSTGVSLDDSFAVPEGK
jgi:phage terminase small subunit